MYFLALSSYLLLYVFPLLNQKSSGIKKTAEIELNQKWMYIWKNPQLLLCYKTSQWWRAVATRAGERRLSVPFNILMI